MEVEYWSLRREKLPRSTLAKGRVESGVIYVKNNFAPLRDFRDLVDARIQCQKDSTFRNLANSPVTLSEHIPRACERGWDSQLR